MMRMMNYDNEDGRIYEDFITNVFQFQPQKHLEVSVQAEVGEDLLWGLQEKVQRGGDFFGTIL